MPTEDQTWSVEKMVEPNMRLLCQVRLRISYSIHNNSPD